jgi:hypothetical protein
MKLTVKTTAFAALSQRRFLATGAVVAAGLIIAITGEVAAADTKRLTENL